MGEKDTVEFYMPKQDVEDLIENYLLLGSVDPDNPLLGRVGTIRDGGVLYRDGTRDIHVIPSEKNRVSGQGYDRIMAYANNLQHEVVSKLDLSLGVGDINDESVRLDRRVDSYLKETSDMYCMR